MDSIFADAKFYHVVQVLGVSLHGLLTISLTQLLSCVGILVSRHMCFDYMLIKLPNKEQFLFSLDA